MGLSTSTTYTIAASASAAPLVSTTVTSGPIDAIFKGLLDSLTERISVILTGAIQNAGDQGSRLIIEACNEVLALIANASTIFENDLSKAFKDLDNLEKNVYNHLNELIGKLETDGSSALAEIKQTIINVLGMLPFVNKESRLDGVHPRYIPVLSSTTIAKVSMKGMFFFASRSDCTPTLSIGKTPCRLVGIDKDMTFDIPVGALTPDQQNPVRTCTYVQGEFHAPWAESHWYWPFRDKIHDTVFKVWFGVLPPTPGKITVNYEAIKSTRVEKDMQSQPMYEENTHRAPTRHVSLSFFPTPGWKYANTPEVIKDRVMGIVNVNRIFLNSEGTQCTVEMTLNGGDWKYVGRLWYHLKWKEEKFVQEKSPRDEVVEDLFWKHSYICTPNEHEKITTIRLEAFNGTKDIFYPESGHSNPFVLLTARDGNVIIHATIPRDDDVDVMPSLKAEGDVKKKKEDQHVLRDKALAHFNTFLLENKTRLTARQTTYQEDVAQLERQMKELLARKVDDKSIKEVDKLDIALGTLCRQGGQLVRDQMENTRALANHHAMQAVYDAEIKSSEADKKEQNSK